MTEQLVGRPAQGRDGARRDGRGERAIVSDAKAGQGREGR
jgi:hypothetical protein